MFCEKCGSEVPDDAEFCTNCGANLKSEAKPKEKVVDDQVELNVKPTFRWGYMILPTLLVYFGIIIILSVFMLAIQPEAAIVVIMSGLGLFIFYAIFWVIGLLVRKAQYANYSYDFYKTKVIYKDSFLNKSEKEVKYKYIREVAMRQSIFQRLFDLGSIILYTNAETGYGNGILIVNISNVQEVYKKIKTMIDV